MTKYIYDERTAPSAPICTFEDGVDGIPTKSLVVTIPATLDGVSAITETQTGENLLDDSLKGISGHVIWFGHTSGNRYDKSVFLKKGTYTLSVEPADGVITNIYVFNSDTQTAINGFPAYNTKSKTFTLSEDTNCAVNVYRQEYTSVSDILTAQIEAGDTTTTYEIFSGTTYTANLGQTIYGGTADIVNGIGKSTGIKKTVRWGDLGNVTQLADVTRKEIVLSANEESKYVMASASTDLVNDKNLPYDMTYSGNFEHIYIANSARIWVYLPNETDANTEITVSYTLADALQTDFTFTGQEIPTKQGYNAFWSDSGDTEVTYYIQIPVEEKYIIGGEILSDIADAIREKKETASPILTEDMADEIRSIEMGGSDLLDLASQSTFDFTDDTYKTSALTIPDRMFNNNQRIRTVNISGIKTVESYAFIQCKATSLSFPDVETIGYQAFFQCRGASDVPLSIPNVVTIGEEAFKEAYVCGESPSYRFLDISKCVTIGNNAFRSTRINGFKMDSVETLGNMPWYGSWFSMTTVVFPKLKIAHDQMCRGMNFTNLVIGPDWQSCGGGFAGYDMDWRNKYVYVYAITPPTMGGDFSLWKPPVAFYVPADSVDAYKAAPYWSQYASIILPLPSDHLTIDTWL